MSSAAERAAPCKQLFASNRHTPSARLLVEVDRLLDHVAPPEVLRQRVQHVEVLHGAGAPGAHRNVVCARQQLLPPLVLLQAIQHTGCDTGCRGGAAQS